MKQKIKEISKKYLVGFIIGSIIFGAAGVYAVTYFPSINTTYDNTESGMTSTNVQDAVDELYEVCDIASSSQDPTTIGNQILEQQPIDRDTYECRYFFTGATPNNYITFNGEKAGWRIISVECDGRVKIMKTASIGGQCWDTSANNNWARPASLNTYLNKTYYNELNATAQSQIVTSEFSIGYLPQINDMVAQVLNENSRKWEGNIALPTVTEYIRTNSNKADCGNYYFNNNNYNNCRKTTWMSKDYYWWLLTPYVNDQSAVHVIGPSGIIQYNEFTYLDDDEVHPALYLSSDVQITGGDGSQNNPYTIE